MITNLCILYFLGLIIISGAFGNLYSTPIGFIILGIGIFMFSLAGFFFHYLAAPRSKPLDYFNDDEEG